MAKHTGFAHGFYRSIAWQQCRAAYVKSKSGLCERCLKMGLDTPGAEVHHKVRLTPENINDPSVTLNWNNLELLCEHCHGQEHKRKAKGGGRWRVDEDGTLLIR